MSLSDELMNVAPIEFAGIEDESLKQKITEALMEVNDPELNIDIVNLGLVYEVRMDENKNLHVKMTLTAIGCPLAGSITAHAEHVLNQLPEVNQAKVELVWSPPWDKSRVSKIAAMQLGIW